MTGLISPLAVPVDGHAPRRATVQNLGDIIGGKGQTFLVIELHSQSETDAVTDWIGHRMPPWPYGGPI